MSAKPRLPLRAGSIAPHPDGTEGEPAYPLHLFGPQEARFLFYPTLRATLIARRSYPRRTNLLNGQENVLYNQTQPGARAYYQAIAGPGYVTDVNLPKGQVAKVGTRFLIADFMTKLRAIQNSLGGR